MLRRVAANKYKTLNNNLIAAREVVQSAKNSVEDATLAQAQVQRKSELVLNEANERARQIDEEVENLKKELEKKIAELRAEEAARTNEEFIGNLPRPFLMLKLY
jgi:predicted Holliday junction resolvase-like endonuclease